MPRKRNDVEHYFKPIFGQKPWRARLGWGSFLTFDFGPEVKDGNSVFGTWHLWVYQCDWRLYSRGKPVVDSGSNKRAIGLAVKKLESMPFTAVEYDARTAETHFRFGHVELVCSPYSDTDLERDLSDTEYWLFYIPQNRVVSVGRDRSVSVGPSTAPQEARA